MLAQLSPQQILSADLAGEKIQRIITEGLPATAHTSAV
jgi:hypothetical protein